MRRILRRGGAGRPRSPLAAASPLLVEALIALAVGGSVGVRGPIVAGVGGLLALAGLVAGVRAAIERDRRRRLADDWILWGAAVRPSATLLSWRAGELASPRLRTALARGLQRIEREVVGLARPGSVPLNQRGLRCNLRLLRALTRRLADRSHPVSVQGIVLADRLLTEPWSPLYSAVSEEELASALGSVLAALDSEFATSGSERYPSFAPPPDARFGAGTHGLR